MNGDSYNIVRAEGGFIVNIGKNSDIPNTISATIYTTRVFTDSAALLNYLHNELVGE